MASETELKSLGYGISQIGSHSIRKGAVGFFKFLSNIYLLSLII